MCYLQILVKIPIQVLQWQSQRAAAGIYKRQQQIEKKKMSANLRVMPLVMPLHRMKHVDHHQVLRQLGCFVGCTDQCSND